MSLKTARPWALSRMATILRASATKLGAKDLLFTLAKLLIIGAGRASLPLDHLFFPMFTQKRIDRPVFILGHPRSGTTFLHRLLTAEGDFPAFQTWELLVPALTARGLVRPLLPALLRLLGRGFHDASAVFAEDAHEVRLDSVEEEELLFLFALDTQFLLPFTALGFVEDDPWDLVFSDRQPERQRRESVELLRGCLQRQLYAKGGDRVLAKMPYSTMRVRTLLEAFPDARFVYLVRSPLETIPSHLSLHRHLFRQAYGLERLPPELLQRYFDRRYRFNVELYRYFDEVQRSGLLGDDALMVIPYPALKGDLQGVFDRLVTFAGLEPTEALRASVAAQAGRQRGYRRAHSNLTVEDFGLPRARVMADLGWVYERYGLPLPEAQGDG